MMQLCGLFPHLQNHAYYADIMLDAYVHLHNHYAKNYAGIIDSGIVSINLALLNNIQVLTNKLLLPDIKDLTIKILC